MNTRSTVKSISMLWVGTLSAAGCQFLVQWLLAKKLGPDSFGSFAAAFALVNTLTALAGFGAYRFLLKAFGEEGWSAIRWLPSAVSFAATTTIAVLLILYAWALGFTSDPLLRVLILVLSPFVAAQVAFEFASSKYQLEERFLLLAAWQFLPPAARLTAVAVAIAVTGARFSALDAAYCYAVIALMTLLIGVVQVRQLCRGELKLVGHDVVNRYPHEQSPDILSVAKRSWPFGMDGLLYLIYLQSGVVILEIVSGASSAGIFNVAMTIVMGVHLLPGVVYQKFLQAKLHRWLQSDISQLERAHRVGQSVMFAVGLVAMIGLWIFGVRIVNLILGEQYEAAGGVLAVLALCIPLRFLSSSYGAIMTVSSDLIVRKLFVMAVAAGISIVCASVLGRSLGAMGAAWACVVAETVMLFGSVWFVRSSDLLQVRLTQHG